MVDYVPPDLAAADRVRLAEAEAEAERRWFGQVASEQLQRFLFDRTEPSVTRQNALAILLERLLASPDLPEGLATLLEPLVDDPDVEVARMAIGHLPLSDERAVVGMRRLLDSTDDVRRAEAAMALARIGDGGVVDTLLAWFHGESAADRNVAIECLVTLKTAQARQILADAWEQGGRGRGDRVSLSTALLRLGDMRGVPFLEEVAQEARDACSVTAATWIYYHQRARGLRLIRDILDRGDLEARQSMVIQVASLTTLPHVFTIEGLSEAKSWVRRQMPRRRNRPRKGG